jgi:hypothetical protein
VGEPEPNDVEAVTFDQSWPWESLRAPWVEPICSGRLETQPSLNGSWDSLLRLRILYNLTLQVSLVQYLLPWPGV